MRRQPFILLSFSSSEKLRKAQETQSYQRFQHIVHTVFNTSGTNAATFVSRGCDGYTLAFANRIAHSGSQGETGAFRTGPLSLPSTRTARSRTSPGRVSERRTLPLLGLGHGCSQRTQRAFGTAMRLCASLFRGAAAPLGCVIFSVSVEIAACTHCSRYFFDSPDAPVCVVPVQAVSQLVPFRLGAVQGFSVFPFCLTSLF